MADIIEEDVSRILPRITDANSSFWLGGANGQLLMARCGRCQRWTHPAPPVCPWCWSNEMAPEPVSGLGHVWTFTINRYAWVPGMTPPYVVATVELDEQPGLRFISNVVDCAVEDVFCGLRVEVVFACHDEVYVPLFRPSKTPPVLA